MQDPLHIDKSMEGGWTLHRIVEIGTKFCISLFAMTILSTIVWERTAGELYDCTDPWVLPGFWEPGNWVHSWGAQAIAHAAKIMHGRSMNEPDTLKEGWSVAGVWRLWLGFAAASLLASIVLARVPWNWRRSRDAIWAAP